MLRGRLLFLIPDTVLKEVKFQGGSAGTSSFDSAPFGPEFAFQRTSKSYWQSGRDSEAKGRYDAEKEISVTLDLILIWRIHHSVSVISICGSE